MRTTIARRGALSLLVLLAACMSVQFVSDYDQQVVDTITGFQQQMEGHLVRLERSPRSPTPDDLALYDSMRVALSGLAVRAQAYPMNELTVQQIGLLRENVDLLEQIHAAGLTAEQVAPLRTGFNTACGAILKLEFAKKRGES